MTECLNSSRSEALSNSAQMSTASHAVMEQGPVGFYVGVDPTGPSLHVGHLVPVFAAVHCAGRS